MHCRVCCSIPDLYPLEAVVTAPLNYDNQKCVQSLPDVLWGQPLNLLVENDWAGVRAELLCSLGLSFQERNTHYLGSSGDGGLILLDFETCSKVTGIKTCGTGIIVVSDSL